MAGEGERASRPSSLVLEAPPPEREPLRFDVQLVGAPPEVEQLVNNIKQVAEDFLYHWKTFPIGEDFFMLNTILFPSLIVVYSKCILSKQYLIAL